MDWVGGDREWKEGLVLLSACPMASSSATVKQCVYVRGTGALIGCHGNMPFTFWLCFSEVYHSTVKLVIPFPLCVSDVCVRTVRLVLRKTFTGCCSISLSVLVDNAYPTCCTTSYLVDPVIAPAPPTGHITLVSIACSALARPTSAGKALKPNTVCSSISRLDWLCDADQQQTAMPLLPQQAHNVLALLHSACALLL